MDEIKSIDILEKVIYGEVTLYRIKCPNCCEINFIGKIPHVCDCGYWFGNAKNGKIRVECVRKRRKTLGKKERKEIIEKQNNRCFWCGREFGTYYVLSGKKGDKLCKLVVHIDHYIPYSVKNTDEKENLVASCNRCNSRKSKLMFKNVDECRHYLIYKWNKNIDTKRVKIL